MENAKQAGVAMSEEELALVSGGAGIDEADGQNNDVDDGAANDRDDGEVDG